MATNTALSAYKAGAKAASKPRGKSRKGKFNFSLAIGAGFVPMALDVYAGAQGGGGIKGAMQNLIYNTTGWNTSEHRWESRGLIRGWSPVIAGVLVHKLATHFGINRHVRKLTGGMISI